MTPLQRYIAEEIATDHVHGLLSRREAIRRLGLLGVTAAAATALITACGEEKKKSPAEQTPPSPGTQSTPLEPPPGIAKALATAPITWAGPNGELQGAWAEAAEPRGAVLVIHENKGSTTGAAR